MEGWFDHLIEDVIWKVIEDELGKLGLKIMEVALKCRLLLGTAT